jgi:murein L,D-transpeptidase YafK
VKLLQRFFSLIALFIVLLCLENTAMADDFSPQQDPLHILVEKSKRRLSVFDGKNVLLDSYKIGLGGNPVGKKTQLDDSKTPEGIYVIDAHNKDSSFYLSLHISYPNKSDILYAQRKGILTGGGIFIHGQPNRKEWMWEKYGNDRDWTNGCVALSNGDMKKLWSLISDGTQIEIKP